MNKFLTGCVVISITLIGASCATHTKTEENKVVSNDLSDEIVCIRTKRVGSHMKVKECMTKSEKERRRKESQERLRQDQDSDLLRTIDKQSGLGK